MNPYLIVIFLALGIAAIVYTVKELAARSRSADQQKTVPPVRSASAAEDCATGCASYLACQNMDLGKAADAGYDSGRVTYCKACGDYMMRRDHCPDFLPHGCQNGICAYARDNQNGRCYCERLGKAVATVSSCPYYKDFFDTELGRGLMDGLSK